MCLTAMALGAAVVLSPWLPLAILLAIAVAWLFTKPVGRLILFAGGTMAIFQSVVLGPSVRTGFLVVALLGAGVALQSISTMDNAATRRLRLGRLTKPIVGLLATVVITLPLMATTGVSPVDWARDATTYLLIVVGPIYGVDAGLHGTRRQVEALTALVGVVGAFAFLVAWLDRRGYGLAGLSQFALASSVLVIPSICMCLALYLRQRTHQPGWLVLGLTQIAMLVMTGGRSSVIYCGAIVTVFVVAGGGCGSRRALRALGILLATVVAAAAALAISSQVVGSNFLIGRYDWFANPSFASVQSDLSGQMRLRAYSILAGSWSEAPLFGKGLGFSYPAVVTGTATPGTYTLDSPLILLSKFGIIGAFVLLTSLAAMVVVLRRLPCAGSTAQQLVRGLTLGLVAAWLAILPGGAPTESKGFGVGLGLLVALCVAWARSIESKPAMNCLVCGLERDLTEGHGHANNGQEPGIVTTRVGKRSEAARQARTLQQRSSTL